jgi:pyruvyltransferase
MIKAWWFNSEGENFGDAICPWILERMTGQEIKRSEEDGSLASIGSILMYNYRAPKVIWGSGAISDYHFSPMIHRHQILAVRGPKSRDRLLEDGIDCPEIYGDPSLLIPYLVDEEVVEKEHEVSFLPHWVDLSLFRSNPTIAQNYNIIDIRSGIDNVLSEIRKSKRIISSSLHGIIVPESFGIPSYFVRVSNRVTGKYFKFEDYYNSTGRELKLFEDIGATNLNVDQIINNYENQKPQIDLKSLLRAFPHKITNEKLIKEFEL